MTLVCKMSFRDFEVAIKNAFLLKKLNPEERYCMSSYYDKALEQKRVMLKCYRKA